MKNSSFTLLLIVLFSSGTTFAQTRLDSLMPIRGLCISAPAKDGVDEFVKFIKEELVPQSINTLVLRVEYNYQYTSHPELSNKNGLTKAHVKQLVAACKEGNINLIPQVNLFGHQSWHGDLGNLLTVYPQFDETPHVQLPKAGEYVWPNDDGLYCKSYCPLHPDVHGIVFDLVDEIMEVFEANAFHAGLDEVFYIGDDKCPRCSGRDKAELFAGEVTKIRNHLAAKNRKLWIWGDRLIDGKTTGIGMWEASMNNTHKAIDLIPKDVVICDWHYERADPTATLFALKGLEVITCPWRKSEVALDQIDMTLRYRKHATSSTKEKYAGMMQTIWVSNSHFLDLYYGRKTPSNPERGDQAGCFKAFMGAISELK